MIKGFKIFGFPVILIYTTPEDFIRFMENAENRISELDLSLDTVNDQGAVCVTYKFYSPDYGPRVVIFINNAVDEKELVSHVAHDAVHAAHFISEIAGEDPIIVDERFCYLVAQVVETYMELIDMVPIPWPNQIAYYREI